MKINLQQPFCFCIQPCQESWYKYAESALSASHGPALLCYESHDPRRRGRVWRTGRGRRVKGWRPLQLHPQRASVGMGATGEISVDKKSYKISGYTILCFQCLGLGTVNYILVQYLAKVHIWYIISKYRTHCI